MAQSLLGNATDEIFAHYHDRYESTLKPGKAPLTKNEVMGIIASNLELAPTTTGPIIVKIEADTSDLEEKLGRIQKTAASMKRLRP